MAIQPGIDVGRYHILERLGEGGMAIVYKAQDKDLSKIVAIKTLRIERLIPAYRDKSLKRFQIEIRQMAKLDHPNIIPILDSGNYEDIPFLVMPFITSGSLKQRIKSHFSWQEAANIVIQLADALGYAHRKNIIHRDVKPSNVLMDESGNPLLADFGIAKVFDNPETIDLTTTMMGIGTPEYMAPELATSRIFDYRVDIYSLGVLFYELLTGRKPFIADTPAAVLIKHATDPLPNPTQFNPDIPREIEDILGKSLAKKPEDRFQTAKDLANSLRDFSGLSPAPELQPVVHKSVSPAIPIISLIGIIGIVVGFGINNNMSKANVSVNDLALATEKDEDQITSPIGVVSSTSNIGSSPQITEIKTISTCEDKAEFVKETIIDGTIFQAGADFTKTWTIKNSGDCVWGSDYALVYEEGDLLSGPDFVSLPHVVNPGESITLEVQLKAPFQSGFYSCYWIFKSDQGENLTRL